MILIWNYRKEQRAPKNARKTIRVKITAVKNSFTSEKYQKYSIVCLSNDFMISTYIKKSCEDNIHNAKPLLSTITYQPSPPNS